MFKSHQPPQILLLNKITILLLFALPLFAQPIPHGPPDCAPSSIERGFASNSKSDVAWAAWCAGAVESQFGRWSQPLRGALATAIASPAPNENKRLLPILIDALFRAHVQLSVPEAIALYETYPDAAIALATGVSQVPDNNTQQLLDLLIRVEREEHRTRWLTLASMLRWSKNFKQHLAEQVRFEYSIDVVDDNDFRPVIALEGAIGGVIGGVFGRIMDGWPQVPNYCLTLSPLSGDEILVASPAANVYVQSSRSPNACGAGNWKDHAKDVVRVLYSFAHCAMCSSGLRIREYPDILGGHAQISWRSSEQVQNLLAQKAENYIDECLAFMNALGEANWSLEQVRQKVTITVSDRRLIKAVALPSPGGVVQVRLP